jgi:hypothetical protein
MNHIITIPLVPPSPNELRRKYRHPLAYRKLRKLWEQELFYGMACSRHRQELLAAAAASERMRVEIVVHHTKEFDPDNLPGACKPILDAMKNCGYIVDDNEKKLQLIPPAQVLSQEKKTVIKIGPSVP